MIKVLGTRPNPWQPPLLRSQQYPNQKRDHPERISGGCRRVGSAALIATACDFRMRRVHAPQVCQDLELESPRPRHEQRRPLLERAKDALRERDHARTDTRHQPLHARE